MHYVSDKDVISIQPLRDLEKQKFSNQVYDEYKLEETNEELKMDLAGYVGDFHRHRIGGEEIKRRTPLTEGELLEMMLKNDRLKEIALAFREIDPDRNGFLTQQELDDIFRENYREQMVGRHIFGLVKEFRSATNKILVDYNRFKKWVYSNLTSRRKKEQRQMKFWSRKESLEKMLNKSRQADTASAVESKFDRSLKSGGRLTEDLLTEVRSYVQTNS